MVNIYQIVCIFLAADSFDSSQAHPNPERDTQIEIAGCTIKCQDVGPPICSKRQSQFKLFTTACEAMLHFCETQEVWKHIDLSICGKYICSAPCYTNNKEFKVCAKNQAGVVKNFTSKCEFSSYACRRHNEKWRMERFCDV